MDLVGFMYIISYTYMYAILKKLKDKDSATLMS